MVPEVLNFLVVMNSFKFKSVKIDFVCCYGIYKDFSLVISKPDAVRQIYFIYTSDLERFGEPIEALGQVDMFLQESGLSVLSPHQYRKYRFFPHSAPISITFS